MKNKLFYFVISVVAIMLMILGYSWYNLTYVSDPFDLKHADVARPNNK